MKSSHYHIYIEAQPFRAELSYYCDRRSGDGRYIDIPDGAKVVLAETPHEALRQLADMLEEEAKPRWEKEQLTVVNVDSAGVWVMGESDDHPWLLSMGPTS